MIYNHLSYCIDQFRETFIFSGNRYQAFGFNKNNAVGKLEDLPEKQLLLYCQALGGNSFVSGNKYPDSGITPGIRDAETRQVDVTIRLDTGKCVRIIQRSIQMVEFDHDG